MPQPQFHETFDWLKPAPLWSADGSDIVNGDLFQPRILMFNSDQFVDELMAVVKQSAMGAGDKLNRQVVPNANSATPFRLYQPAHLSYYFVCASLCCRQAGFPDRAFSRAQGDRVVFVIRKLAAKGGELGWIGPNGQKQWSQIGQPATTLDPQEDRLPLMNANTQDGRTLLFGYIPVGSRETYAAGPSQLNVPAKNDLRVQEFGSRFTGNLIPYFPDPSDPTHTKLSSSILEQLPDAPTQLLVSVNILRDVVGWFQQYLPEIGQALVAKPVVTLSGASQAVVNLLNQQIIKGTVSIWTALQLAATNTASIDANQDVKTLGFTDDYNLVHLIANLKNPPGGVPDPNGVNGYGTKLNAAVQAALPSSGALSPDFALSGNLPKFAGNDTYILRLAYERTACDPPQQWLSRKTAPFELAGFFDTDAPARPIRITMPGDVSLAGIRKFKKNVSIIMSAGMRQKMNAVAGNETNITAGKGGGGGSSNGLGFICSFSIQIIFIVAFMLLLIFVVLLNLVFFWLPFFKICFPVPASLAPKSN